ncbi:MAG: PQQ-dependent sugar dehydrogenase [Rubripirellula sp.]
MKILSSNPYFRRSVYRRVLLVLMSVAPVCLWPPCGSQPSSASEPDQAGVSQRHPWVTSKVRGTPDPPLPYTVQQVMADVELDRPTEMTRVPGTERWIVCQPGKLHSFARTEDGRSPQLSLDMHQAVPKSGQIYGVTFHPKFPEEPWCYIAFTAEPKTSTGTRLSRFRVTDPSVPIIDPKSEVIYAGWNSEGHSGGSLHFGKDGYLYVSVGDGQNPNPPDRLHTGQDLSDLEASILRIDVDHQSDGLPYGIPEDNPFVDREDTRGEVWAFGFRNPWKMAFDPNTDTLWTGDVGWEMMEMVYRIDRGGNYGWSVMEGSQVVKKDGARDSVPITPPVVEHNHLEARSITGGYFWQSERLPELQGAYIYGDWMTGKIWGLKHDGEKVTWHEELADTNLQVICFALDDDGEVLVVGFDGTVHRLIENVQPIASADFPRRLSETGLFRSVTTQEPLPGVIPYEINAHHWSDHTTSEQWIAIPDMGRLGVFDKSDWKTGQVEGHFIFPHDTVLAKTVSYMKDVNDAASKTRLETQLLHRNGDDWNAYNYIWNEEQTEATLQDNVASDRELVIVDPRIEGGLRKQTWHHASRDECSLCHIWSASTIHGFKINQLNRSSNHHQGNQLDRFDSLGLFDAAIEPAAPLASPDDESKSLHDRARSYLHMNCAHCHRRGGGGTAAFELVGNKPLAELDLVDAKPTQGEFGLTDSRVVASGHPEQSVLLYRLAKSGRGHMPQFGPNLLDERGIRLVHDWIVSLGGENAGAHAAEIQQRLIACQTPLSSSDVAWTLRQFDSLEDSITLSAACCSETVAPAVRREIATVAAASASSSTRDLFERYLPAEQRIKRLGTSIDPIKLLAINGDPESGRRQFVESADVNCRQCHQIGAIGVEVGPDLSGIGAQRTREEILRSLLQPSEKIDDKYRGKTVLTVDGEIIAGMVVREDRESITLVETSGKERVIAEADIESVKLMQKSVMPDLLLSEFTAQQAADLLAFLFAQKSVKELGNESSEKALLPLGDSDLETGAP